MKKIVYVDLDNTLVDFESGIKKCSPEVLAQYADDGNGKQHYDDIPGLFALMDEMKGAREAFLFLAEHFDTYILSKPFAYRRLARGKCDCSGPLLKRVPRPVIVITSIALPIAC